MKKVVIAAAGLGTRLLPATKELPKEMLPVFAKRGDKILLKPMLQLIFEQLYQHGFREFCFIVGRGKRSVEDHFTPDWSHLDYLRDNGKIELVYTLEEFYRCIETSNLVWINQPKPMGFGHAVLLSRSFVGDDPFVVVAGDTFITVNGKSPYPLLLKAFEGSEVSFLVEKVADPRNYGVAVLEKGKVKDVVEKPEHPPSKYAIMPIYAFKPSIFRALTETMPGVHGELQLTDAIRLLIQKGCRVNAPLLRKHLRLDIGTPETYWEALKLSYMMGD
jgi:UTP--glucose-1-phosphate uridylyltransferase